MVAMNPLMAEFSFLIGDSQMSQLVRSFDWSNTSLGPATEWPPELKTSVAHVLDTRFPAALVWGDDLTTIYNDAFRPILGNKPEALGRSFRDVWSDVWDDIGSLVQRALSGESVYIENFALVTERSGTPEQAYFTFCYSPVRRADGTVAGLIDTVIETTPMVMAQRQRELLNQELSHRLRNTIAMVQAIATQTLKNVTEQDAVSALQQRMVVMGQAHDILLRQEWAAASLRNIIQQTLAPIDGNAQISYEGSDLVVGPKAVLTISLTLHELATNAFKYGALSTSTGRVLVSWLVRGDEFRLHWRETGGPEVAEPTKKGFGSRLIDMGFGGGTVEKRFNPSGLEVDIVTPLRNLTEAGPL